MKIDKLNTNQYKKENLNDKYSPEIVRDLFSLLKTNTTVPTYKPKKFIDCFYLYWDGSTTYELYLYINNSWKSVTIS